MTSISSKKPLGDGFAVTYSPDAKGKGYRATRVFVGSDDAAGGIECLVCGATKMALPVHVLKKHGLSVTEYRARFGQRAPMVSDDVLEGLHDASIHSADLKHRAAGFFRCRKCGAVFEKPRNSAGARLLCAECRPLERRALMARLAPLGGAVNAAKPVALRSSLLVLLSGGARSTAELASATQRPLKVVNAALTILREQGLVVSRRSGMRAGRATWEANRGTQPAQSPAPKKTGGPE